jgi:hypothetical protein
MYRGYKYFEDEEGRRWIIDFINGFRYPLFNHPEINENSTQEELRIACEQIDKEWEVIKNG